MRKNKDEKISYFGFPIIVKPSSPFTRNDLTQYLEAHKIGTRNVFSGNLLRHPAYIKNKDKIKIVGKHENADLVMNNAFWIGVFPGITGRMIDYIKTTVKTFLEKYE